MIRVSIGSSIVEGENDVRLELANNLCGMANQLLLWNVLELAIAIVQATYVLHAEFAPGTSPVVTPALTQPKLSAIIGWVPCVYPVPCHSRAKLTVARNSNDLASCRRATSIAFKNHASAVSSSFTRSLPSSPFNN